MVVTDAQKEAVKQWFRVIRARSGVGEQGLYGEFQRRVLEDLLGYDRESIFPLPNRSVQSEETDFTIKRYNDHDIFIEAKKLGTKLNKKQYRSNKEHDTPIAQLWDYMICTDPPIRYGICTNYEDFWLFTLNTGKNTAHKFSLKTAISDDDKLREFIWAFKTILTGDNASELHTKSIKYDQDITEQFYKLFHDTRTLMIKEFGAGDADANDAATSTAQTFLNRLTFVLFAESLRLADRRIVDAIEAASRNATSTSSNAYDAILNIFDAYDKGKDGAPEFNGGLFAERIDRNVRFLDKNGDGSTDNPIITNILGMSKYNFKTDLNVNILGHIFEQSISDLDKANKGDERKREGIYYTPEQITEYICDNTIIPYLSKSHTSTNAHDLVDEYVGALDVLDAKLRSVRILDPACGSGAFLIKAAETILGIHKLIWETRGISDSMDVWIDETRIREIILRNIYGVDKSTDSVGITKLALFLKTAQKGEKLPSLDGNIKVGNSSIRNKEAVSNAFDWEYEFSDILNPIDPDGFGFDVIIGNPPYIRHEDLKELKRHMQLPEPNNLGIVDFEIPSTSDLSSYFYYHSLNLLKDGGYLGFITSDSWLHMNYGPKLQEFFLEHSTINALLRTVANVFNDADTKTAIITLTRQAPNPSNVITAVLASDPHSMSPLREWKVPQSNLKPGNWNLLFVGQEYKPKVGMINLGNAGKLTSGTKTGNNGFFTLTPDIVDEYDIPEEFMKPMFHKNIHDGLLADSDAINRLLDVNESKGELVKTEGGKKVLKYLEMGETHLVVPQKGTDRAPRPISQLASLASRPTWYSLKLKTPPPIFLGRFSHEYMKMYENNRRFFALDNCAYFTPKIDDHVHAFLAYFTSSWFLLYLERNGHVAGGGALQFYIKDYRNTPVPDFSIMPKKDVEKIRQAWLKYRDDFDRERLDDTVLKLLGFDGSEQKTIRQEVQTRIEARISKK